MGLCCMRCGRSAAESEESFRLERPLRLVRDGRRPDSEPLMVLGGTWATGDRSMTISSSPSSSSSLIAWSSANDALLNPSPDNAFDSRLLSVLEYSDSPSIERELRSFDNVLAFPGLEGADPENVYVPLVPGSSS